MERSETLTIGDHVYVDDELRTGIECVVRGFNDIGEPILQALDGALRFRGCDRRVLDFPWEKVSREPRLPTLLEAATMVVNAARHWDGIRWKPGICGESPFGMIDDLRAAVQRERDQDLPF